MNKNEEFKYLLSFPVERDFDEDMPCQQLRSLWTSYCLHYKLDVDTAEHDAVLWDIWSNMKASESDAACWNDYESFASFMCAELVC